MNEHKLKELLISSINSGHILNNCDSFFPVSTNEVEIRMANEAYFRSFESCFKRD